MALALQFLDFRGLVLGTHTREDPVNAQILGYGVRDGLRVAGDHDDLGTRRVQCVDGVAGLGADLVGKPECSDHFAVGEDVENDRALLSPLVCDGELFGGMLLKQVGAADLDYLTVNSCLHAHSWRRGEVAGARHSHVTGLRRTGDGASEWVLTVRLGGRCQREHVCFLISADGVDRGDGGFAFGEGAGLVEQHGVDGAHGFESEPILDQYPAAGGALSRNRDDQRDCET